MKTKETETATAKESLILEVSRTANWRWEKAEQYPTDKHNEDAALDLRDLEVHLKSLPEDHLVFEWYGQLPDDLQDGWKSMDDFRESLKSYGYQWNVDSKEWINEIIGIED